MSRDRFESARAKIDRAKYHFSQLEGEFQRDWKAEKYGARLRYESQTDELVIRAVDSRELFVHYSVIASEIISHARSALDHAIWEITPLADRSRRTAFPVFQFETKSDRISGTEGYYDRDSPSMIKGINAQAVAIIRAQQPFGPNYQTDPLYVLNNLWNEDKHRLLNLCVVHADIIAIDSIPLPRGSGKITQRFIFVPPDTKEGTELFREARRTEMEVVANIGMTGIVFEGGIVNGKPVLEVLSKLIEFSEGVINALAKTV
jgi:hypothetical protein